MGALFPTAAAGWEAHIGFGFGLLIAALSSVHHIIRIEIELIEKFADITHDLNQNNKNQLISLGSVRGDAFRHTECTSCMTYSDADGIESQENTQLVASTSFHCAVNSFARSDCPSLSTVGLRQWRFRKSVRCRRSQSIDGTRGMIGALDAILSTWREAFGIKQSMASSRNANEYQFTV